MPEQEDDLAQTIKMFHISGFPLTINRVCQLAFQYMHVNNIEGFNNIKNNQAGHKCVVWQKRGVLFRLISHQNQLFPAIWREFNALHNYDVIVMS